MPPKAKTQEQLIFDKNKMIDKAVSLIRKEGLENFSIRKLSKHMGMSPANIYNYFYSKDEIYINIRMRGFNLLHQEYDSLVTRLSDPLERLEGYIRKYISFGIKYPGYYQLMLSTNDPKSLDYIGSPLEDLAKKEKENAMKTHYYLLGIIRECSPTMTESEAYTTATRIACEFHGVISLYHSNILLELSADVNDVIDSLIEHIKLEFSSSQ